MIGTLVRGWSSEPRCMTGILYPDQRQWEWRLSYEGHQSFRPWGFLVHWGPTVFPDALNQTPGGDRIHNKPIKMSQSIYAWAYSGCIKNAICIFPVSLCFPLRLRILIYTPAFTISPQAWSTLAETGGKPDADSFLRNDLLSFPFMQLEVSATTNQISCYLPCSRVICMGFQLQISVPLVRNAK